MRHSRCRSTRGIKNHIRNIMVLDDEKTWPAEVVIYLKEHHDIFRNWELRNNKMSALDYDRAIDGLLDILGKDYLRDYLLFGYHCTRLTPREKKYIKTIGMRLPNQKFLNKRITCIEKAGIIDSELAEYLKSKNQANDRNRAKKIWFCFYPPYIAGQSDIERLFRSWGGESLYNSHERDKFSGPRLKNIGNPCIVKAYVPITSLISNRTSSKSCHSHTALAFKIIDWHLYHRGVTRKPDRYDDWAEKPIRSRNISCITQFPKRDFVNLTKCDTWNPTLT